MYKEQICETISWNDMYYSETHVQCQGHRVILWTWRKVAQTSTSCFKRFRGIVTQTSRRQIPQVVKTKWTLTVQYTQGGKERKNVNSSTMIECTRESYLSDCTSVICCTNSRVARVNRVVCRDGRFAKKKAPSATWSQSCKSSSDSLLINVRKYFSDLLLCGNSDSQNQSFPITPVCKAHGEFQSDQVQNTPRAWLLRHYSHLCRSFSYSRK